MKETIDLFGKILTNILTALYEPFGFSLLLSFLAMFFYLYAYEPTAACKGWKNAIVTGIRSLKRACSYENYVNVNYIFKKKRNLMFRKNVIIFFRIFDESLEACDSQFAIL